jgi:hypothetical protein
MAEVKCVSCEKVVAENDQCKCADCGKVSCPDCATEVLTEKGEITYSCNGCIPQKPSG